MKWNTVALHIVGIVIAIFLYLAQNVESHIKTISINPKDLYVIYTLENSTTGLLYHLDTGIVYKQDKKGLYSVYAHAHIICSEFLPEEKILGYINKNKDCSAPRQYYVYIKLK